MTIVTIQGQYPQLFTAPRIIADTQVNMTPINNELYLTKDQTCQVLGVSASTFLHHAEEYFAEGVGGSLVSTPYSTKTIYVISVNYVRDPSDVGRVGSGGGVQQVKFYALNDVIQIATRMRNTERKQAIINELVTVYNEYQRNAVVINNYAIANDPDAYSNAYSRVAYNFSPERHGMTAENKTMNGLIYLCSDVYNADGSLNMGIARRCMQMMHNTAHVSTHGMTAAQVVFTRGDPNHPHFNLKNFTGKDRPNKCDLGNGCNQLEDDELLTRTSVIQAAIGRIRTHVRLNGPITWDQMLRMFTMFCVSPHIPFLGWNWVAYPRTAISPILNMPNSKQIRKQIRLMIEEYLANFPIRLKLSPVDTQRFLQIEAQLEEICISGENMYETA